jgi:hypothetical protein
MWADEGFHKYVVEHIWLTVGTIDRLIGSNCGKVQQLKMVFDLLDPLHRYSLIKKKRIVER